MDKELKQKYTLHIQQMTNDDLLKECLLCAGRHDGSRYTETELWKYRTAETELSRRLKSTGFLKNTYTV